MIVSTDTTHEETKINEDALKRAQDKLRANKMSGGYGTIEYAHPASDARDSMRASFEKVMDSENITYDADKGDPVIDIMHDFMVTRNDHDKRSVELFNNLCREVLDHLNYMGVDRNGETSFSARQGNALNLLLNYNYRSSEAFKNVVVSVSQMGSLLEFCNAVNVSGSDGLAFSENTNVHYVKVSLLKYYSAMTRAYAENDERFWKLPVEWQIQFGG